MKVSDMPTGATLGPRTTHGRVIHTYTIVRTEKNFLFEMMGETITPERLCQIEGMRIRDLVNLEVDPNAMDTAGMDFGFLNPNTISGDLVKPIHQFHHGRGQGGTRPHLHHVG